MNFSQFQKTLAKNNKLSPLLVVCGKETFLKIQAIHLIKEQLGEDKTFTKEYLGSSQPKLDLIFADLCSQPLFEEWNLIILREADSLLANLYEPIAKYLAAPFPQAIFLIELTDLDQRTRFAKLVISQATLIECNPLKDSSTSAYSRHREDELGQWIANRATFYHKKIESNAGYLLQELVGSNLSDLDLQMQKLVSFVGGREQIELTDVQALVGKSKRTNIFEFLDVIFAQNLAQSLSLCSQLFERGNIGQNGELVTDEMSLALQFLRLLHYRARQLWKLGVTHDPAGIPPFLQNKMKEQTRHFPAQKLMAIWAKLLETEFALKSSQIEPALAIEQLILLIAKPDHAAGSMKKAGSHRW